jgi:hypothetical protein
MKVQDQVRSQDGVGVEREKNLSRSVAGSDRILRNIA